jgi:hypothetical protein
MAYTTLTPYGLDKITSKIGETTSSIADKFNVGNIVGTVEKTSYVITSNLRDKMPSIVTTSLLLIASLTLNDAFTSLINQYVPPQYRSADNVKVKFVYALVLTIVIIIIISVLLQYPSK